MWHLSHRAFALPKSSQIRWICVGWPVRMCFSPFAQVLITDHDFFPIATSTNVTPSLSRLIVLHVFVSVILYIWGLQGGFSRGRPKKSALFYCFVYSVCATIFRRPGCDLSHWFYWLNWCPGRPIPKVNPKIYGCVSRSSPVSNSWV